VEVFNNHVNIVKKIPPQGMAMAMNYQHFCQKCEVNLDHTGYRELGDFRI
jgi:hypothetical protein